MPTVMMRVDAEVKRAIEEQQRPRETHNQVLRRILRLDKHRIKVAVK